MNKTAMSFKFVVDGKNFEVPHNDMILEEAE